MHNDKWVKGLYDALIVFSRAQAYKLYLNITNLIRNPSFVNRRTLLMVSNESFISSLVLDMKIWNCNNIIDEWNRRTLKISWK